MTLRDTILDGTKDLGVYKLEINKDITVHGVPSTQVVAYAGKYYYSLTYANSLKLDNDHVTKLIRREIQVGRTQREVLFD